MHLQKDSVRNYLAWVNLVLVVGVLWLLKPNINVFERAMYLPLVTDRDSISNSEVSILTNNNYFLYNKIGYITIILPNPEDDGTKLNAITLARSMAANAGAEKLLLEGMRAYPWFDSGKDILRLQAVAMSRS